MTYNVYGEIKFDVEIEVEADSETAAMAKADELLQDYYHLDVMGAYHDRDDVNIKLDADELLNQLSK